MFFQLGTKRINFDKVVYYQPFTEFSVFICYSIEGNGNVEREFSFSSKEERDKVIALLDSKLVTK